MAGGSRMKRLLRSAWIAAAESLLGVATVAVLSAIFLLALFAMFPKGTGLVDVYGEFVGVDRPRDAAGPGFAAGIDQPIVARLSRVVRQVKDRPADAVVWNASSRGMAVEHQHAIQTFERSGATIEIAGREAIRMGENSLIVFRQPARDERGRRRRASIALLGGEIRGSMVAGAGQVLDIVTANASTRIRGNDGEKADYAISVGPDNSSTIKVFSGNAEVTAGGERAVLQPNEAVTVFPDQTLGEPFEVAPAPRGLDALDGGSALFGSVVPRVPFRWSAVPGADAYRLVVARDSDLESVVYDAVIDEREFVHGALEPGTYHWQVTAIRDALEGIPSSVQLLELVQDVEPPALDVALVSAALGELLVQGTTEPGAQVFVGETMLTASAAGTFEHAVSLSRGVNMIVVEAVDAVGNSSYYSEYVDENGRPRRSP